MAQDRRQERSGERPRRSRRASAGSAVGFGILYVVAVIGLSILLACLIWIAANDLLALNKPEHSATVVLPEEGRRAAFPFLSWNPGNRNLWTEKSYVQKGCEEYEKKEMVSPAGSTGNGWSAGSVFGRLQRRRHVGGSICRKQQRFCGSHIRR